MKYSMAGFTKRMGLGRETLRYYEQKGLIEPERKDGSNYRVYSDTDGLDILRIRLMQSFHLSLDNIEEWFEHSTLSQQERHLRAVERELEEQLTYIQTKLARVRKNHSFVCDALAADGKVCELQTYGIYKLMLLGKGVNEDARRGEIAAQWLRHMPVTDIGWEISLADLQDPDKEKVDVRIGMMMLVRYAEEYEIDIQPPVYLFPPGKSIRMMIATENPFEITRAQLEPLFRYAKEKNYQIISDVSGRYSGSESQNGKTIYYFSARMLVK